MPNENKEDLKKVDDTSNGSPKDLDGMNIKQCPDPKIMLRSSKGLLDDITPDPEETPCKDSEKGKPSQPN